MDNLEMTEEKVKKGNKGKKTHDTVARVMCFLLGVLLTLSAVLVRDRFIVGGGDVVTEVAEATEDKAEAEESAEVDVANSEAQAVVVKRVPVTQETNNELLADETTIGDSHVEVAELEEYSDEVEQKLLEYRDQPALERTDDVNYTSTLIANTDGKPSKLNWKDFYAAVNTTINTSLEQKQAERSSYEETLATNAFDKKIIEENKVSFAGVKITVMGDSISAASNLEEDVREEYNWPRLMGEILGCEVNNMSIGGSSISSCATTDPMVNRWSGIPTDSDIIIVFGGTNDCLFETRDQYGFLEYDKRMNKDTFCGDLDRMLSAMKYTYRDTLDDHYVRMIYVNPPSTILNDGVVAVDPNKYVPQWEYAADINEMAPNYGFDVIDLYNTNFLNSHDYNVNSEFILDGVHGNVAAYTILAEHMASQIIQMVQAE